MGVLLLGFSHIVGSTTVTAEGEDTKADMVVGCRREAAMERGRRRRRRRRRGVGCAGGG